MVLNKLNLPDAPELAELARPELEKRGYRVFEVSTKTGEGLNALKFAMARIVEAHRAARATEELTYYAGAKFAENDQDLLSNGGRVYMLVTTVDTVKEAQDTIYKELDKQKTEGLFYRTDIGSKANK